MGQVDSSESQLIYVQVYTQKRGCLTAKGPLVLPNHMPGNLYNGGVRAARDISIHGLAAWLLLYSPSRLNHQNRRGPSQAPAGLAHGIGSDCLVQRLR